MQVGIDEAGRGSLVSRVYAAAVIIPDREAFDGCVGMAGCVIRDSKKMTARQRDRARDFLLENVAYGIGHASEAEIDAMGIVPANILAMHRAVDDLRGRNPGVVIEKMLVDGTVFRKYGDTPFELVVRGESIHPEIAAASILAKTARDAYILGCCDNDPSLDAYGLRSNKGYGTAAHMNSIREHGLSAIHRRSFTRHLV